MKRIAYILAVFIVSVLLLACMLVGALMSDKVQTAVVRLVAEELARTFGTRATIGEMEYHFPARVAIRDVYIEDQQHDTLLFAGELYAHFRPAALRDNEIRFSHVRLRDVVANIYHLPDSTWNYAFLVPPSDEQKNSPLQSLVSVRDIRLDNIRLRVEDYTANLTHATMDLHHLSEEELDAEILTLTGQITKKALMTRFDIDDLKARLIFNDTLLMMPTLALELPHSSLDMSGVEIRFPEGDTLYLSKSAHDIQFGLQFHKAELVPSDLALFIPRLARLNKPIALSGDVGGSLDSLSLNAISIRYDGNTVLEVT